MFGIFYATSPHTAFVGTLAVAIVIALLTVVSALRSRPPESAPTGNPRAVRTVDT